MKFCISSVAAVLIAATVLSSAAKAAPSVFAKSAIVYDADTAQVLFDKSCHSRSLIASTTKIMTGYLIAKDCALDEMVTIPSQAAGIEGSSLELRAGESRTVEELLYGMMLHSGNDAAMALAIYHSGTVAEFVRNMNQTARDFGLENTSFANPHGLDSEENFSTAYDLAVLTAVAMEDPVFYRVVSTKTVTINGREYKNHNRLLWQYEGTIGVKTGYTKAAGRILVSCAQRNGRRLIAITICAPDDWRDHRRMFDYGFSSLEGE